jgi:hypothetical protein
MFLFCFSTENREEFEIKEKKKLIEDNKKQLFGERESFICKKYFLKKANCDILLKKAYVKGFFELELNEIVFLKEDKIKIRILLKNLILIEEDDENLITFENLYKLIFENKEKKKEREISKNNDININENLDDKEKYNINIERNIKNEKNKNKILKSKNLTLKYNNNNKDEILKLKIKKEIYEKEFLNEIFLKNIQKYEEKLKKNLKNFEELIKELKKLKIKEYIELLILIPNSHLTNDAMSSIIFLNENLFNFSFPEICEESIKYEINLNNRYQNLFRTNSLFTKYLSLYFKFFGQQYLTDNFSKFINKICNEDKNYEVNHGDDKKDLIEKNVKNIESLVLELFNLLIKSVDNIPIELKYILNILNYESDKKYENFGLISVGSLFFLRFLCPSFCIFKF